MRTTKLPPTGSSTGSARSTHSNLHSKRDRSNVNACSHIEEQGADSIAFLVELPQRHMTLVCKALRAHCAATFNLAQCPVQSN